MAGMACLSPILHFQLALHIFSEFVEYAVHKDASQFKVLPENSGLPWSVYVGSAGMPGKTAYFAWKVDPLLP
jgi:NADPH-dependent curcumin reductase CurA